MTGPVVATVGDAASQVLPGRVLLLISVSDDPSGTQLGSNHEGYPAVMTLACISLDDVETAAMLPIDRVPRSEALAQGDIAP